MRERILLIEDDQVLQDSINELLSIHGFDVVAFSNPEKALISFNESSFDLVLCDNRMPVMSGLEVLKHIRTQQPDRFIPFIMITAYDDRNTYRSAMLGGADDFINKPFKSAELIASVQKQIQKLNSWKDQLEAYANFPNENPNPVTRVNTKSEYQFSNPTFKLLYASLTQEERSFFDRFIFTGVKEAMKVAYNLSRQLELKSHLYNVTFSPQTDKAYTNIYFSDISVILKTEEKMKRQELFYKEILDNLPADLGVFTPEMRYAYVNPHGIKNPEIREWIIGKTDLDYIELRKPLRTDHIDRRAKAFQQAKNELKNVEWIDDYILPDGTIQYVQRTFHPVINEQGNVSMMIGYGTDITERQLAAEEVIQSRLRYKTLFDNNPQMAFIVNQNGKVLDVNNAACFQLGYSYIDLINSSVLNLFPAHYHKTVTKTIEMCFKESDKQHSWELIKHKKDGTLIHVFEVARTIQLTKESEPVLLVVCTDITEKKQNETLLQETSDLNKMLIEEMPVPVAVIKMGEFVNVNNSFSQLFGYSEKELKGKLLTELVEKSYCDLLTKKIEERYKSNIRVMECEVEVFSKNGQKSNVIISGTLFTNKGETYTLAAFNDITEIRIAQSRELEAESRSKTILNASLDAVILININGEVIEWNNQAHAIFGFSADEAKGKKLEQLIVPAGYSEQHRIGMEKYRKTGHGPALNKILELPAVHKDGHEIPVELFIVPIEIQGKTMFSAFIRNIEDRKKAENQLRALANELSQQNEDLKRFAYITSHDLRAPVINLNTLLDYYDYNNPASALNADLIERFKQSANRISETLNDLLEVTKIKDRTQALQKTNCNVAEIFDQCIRDNEEELRKAEAEIETSYDATSHLLFHKTVLNSVFTNFITNSIKYRSPDRKLKIQLSTSITDTAFYIRFADNGLGMDMDKLKNRLFSLYQRFHTHVDGKGLGLYLVKSQLEAAGAELDLNSKVDAGSEFIIKIPFITEQIPV